VKPAVAAFALLACFGASPALAHDQPFSYADVIWSASRLEVRISVHRDDAGPALGVAPESLMSAPFLARHADSLGRYLSKGFLVEADGRRPDLRLVDSAPNPPKLAMTLTFNASIPAHPGHLHFSVLLFPADPQHATFFELYRDGRLLKQDVMTVDHATTDVYARGAPGVLAVVGLFLKEGVKHIFTGPDHILFLVGLLLLGGGVLRVLSIATAFTIAHSITLALSALGIVVLPGRLVEPAIALSIICVGIENLRARPGKRDVRVAIAFFFGLVHGFGFASVLHEIGLPREALGSSLLAFNLGVEVGQACIILTVTPLLAAVRKGLPRVAPRAIAAGSWGIILAGAYWLGQRLFAA